MILWSWKPKFLWSVIPKLEKKMNPNILTVDFSKFQTMWRALLVFKRSYVESIHVLIRVLFCTLGIQELLWHLPHFLRVWFLTDFDVEFLEGKPQQENEMCKCVQLLLERITQFWIIKCRDPLILGSLMSVIFMLWIKKKDQIYDPVILRFAFSLIQDQKSRDLMVLISVIPVITWSWSE